MWSVAIEHVLRPRAKRVCEVKLPKYPLCYLKVCIDGMEKNGVNQ